MEQKQKKQKKQMELRTIIDNISTNESGDCVVSGKAICFNDRQLIYQDRVGNSYYEVIDSHALDNCDLSDVCLKYNHGQEKLDVLARVRQKTLTLEIKDDGLYFTATLNSNLGQDVYKAVQEREITGCSFGFFVDSDDYDDMTNTRSILSIETLTEISIVDEPAYSNTSVEARDYYQAIEKMKEIEQKKRQRLILLSMV